jgi:hypothetical protein
MTPTSRNARIAGLLYLLLAIVGPLRLMYIPKTLFVQGNAAATAANIAAHETLFRLGNSGCPAAVAHLPFHGAYQGHGLRSCRGSHRHPLALCSRTLREEAWRSMEVIATVVKLAQVARGTHTSNKENIK